MIPINQCEKEKIFLCNLSAKIRETGKEFIKNSPKDEDSYYKKVSHRQEEYLREYSFDSITELKSNLVEFWKKEEFMKEFIPCILASAFKSRLETNGSAHKTPLIKAAERKEGEMLPTYIYTL